jgi:hypothetical protein
MELCEHTNKHASTHPPVSGSVDFVIHVYIKFVNHKYREGVPPMDEIYGKRLARVADLYYQKRWTRNAIAEEISKERKGDPFHPSNVNRWLKDARDYGVITFDIDPSFAITGRQNDERAQELADLLTEALNLDVSLVIEVGTAPLQDTRAAAVHIALANNTGARLSDTLENNSSLLVAGGRTVVQIARMVGRRRPKKSNIRIDPLSGRNWVGSWQVDAPDDLERPLDSDDAAVILSTAFPKRGTRFSQIGSPLYAETHNQARIIMRDHCAFLPDGGWNWDLPERTIKRAICGIGTLHPLSGHRIMRFLATHLRDHGVNCPEDLKAIIEDHSLSKMGLPRPDRAAPYLSRVAVDLIDAIAFSAAKGLGYFADVANRLYPCLPLPDELAAKRPQFDDYVELVEKLDVLNRRAIVMQWSHLREIPTWVTAGGDLKFPAIWTLAITRYLEKRAAGGSRPGSGILSKVTTDSATAQNLLNALNAFDTAPDIIQDWYAKVTPILFQPNA